MDNLGSCGAVDVNELVRQAQLGRHRRPQCGRAVALGGVVATGQVGHTAFARQMGLGLREFTGDEGIDPSGDGGLEIVLRAAAAPADAPQGPLGGVDERHRTPQALLHMHRQRAGVGAIGVAHETQILLAKTAPAIDRKSVV